MLLVLAVLLSTSVFADLRAGPAVVKTAYVTGDAAELLLKAFPAEAADSKSDRVYRKFKSKDGRIRIHCSNRTEMVADYPNCTIDEVNPEKYSETKRHELKKNSK